MPEPQALRYKMQVMSPTINFRVLLLAVLPVTAVSIIFFGYFFKKQIDDTENNIIDKGKSLAAHLAIASEYGIFSGNMTILSPLVESAFTKNDIISVTITNNQGIPLIQKSRTGNSPLPPRTPENKHSHVFSQPVIQNTVDINDFEDTDHKIPPVIGWVIVEVSNERAQQNKRNAIFQMLSITLLILVGSIFLAMRISRHITKPVSSLTDAVNKIENGNLDVSIETLSTGALLTLEKGVRSMLQSIRLSHREDQNTIRQTTTKLQESRELLEQRNSELTITRQQALSVNQEKSTFLTNISHEIKTPMNEILGFVKLLKNTDLSQEQTDYLYTIEKSATSLLRVINDVLDFSKIEAGKFSANNIHFNLEECIENVLALVAPSAHEKGIEISSLYYDDTPKKLFGSSDRIRQILVNLVGNAIKFSDQGTIMVRTMLESQKDDTVQIKITVTDQGPGISEKDKAVLFDTPEQMHDNNTRSHDTGGLGLATSRTLTEAMHGKIGAESSEGNGSVFWFTFECQFTNWPGPVPANEHLPYYSKSVALYDGNELTRTSLTHSFQRLGFDVTECLDIENLCVPHKISGMPAICVLSINSHEASSTTTREFLEAHRNNTSSKILVIVSKSDPLVLKTLRDWGADACLSKPFRHADFEKKLVTIFRSPKNFYGQKNKTGLAHKPATPIRLDGLNILIAEDNAVNARLTETILCRAGAIPNIVNNGKEAVAAFNRDKFDIILMDIHMPEMNGVDAARKIRETEPPPARIGIIGLTAASQSKNGPLSQNPDFDEILEKPIAVNALLAAITWWTGAHNKSAEGNKPAIHNSTGDLGIDKGLSMTLNEMLLRELPEAKEKLQAAYKSGDSRFLRNEIHRLLGGMAYCDFTELHQLTLQYQTSLKANKDTMDENFQQMIAEMEHLLTTKIP